MIAADRRLRDSLASLLAATGRVDVIGLAIDSPAALRLPGPRQPDLILVDPALVGGANGPLVARLRQQVPDAMILLLAWDDRSDPIASRQADGVLDVGNLPGALLAALDSAGLGGD